MNVCGKDEICVINEKYQYTLYPLFYGEYSKGKCSAPILKKYVNRYPGEDCNENTKCQGKNSVCLNGKCTGKNEGEICGETSECKVGLFCSSKTKKCQRQLKEGEQCVSSYDCVNYLGCYMNKCTKFGTLKKGARVDSVKERGAMKYLFCNNGCVSEDKNFCTETDYAPPTLGKKKQGGDTVECQFNEPCYYTDGYVTFNKTCICSFTEEGKGYCPIPTKYRFKNWNEKVIMMAEKLNNDCHSLSRSDCYKSDNDEYSRAYRAMLAKTDFAAAFEGAVPCALKFFGVGGYIKYSYILLIFISIILTTSLK